MTKTQAAEFFKAQFHAEIAPRLSAARPKLLAYEAHILTQKAREIVLASYETATESELKEKILEPFKSLTYLKRSGY